MIGAAWRLLRDAVKSWSDDYAPSMGAAIAYYTVFSIAPLVLIVISVAGLVFGEEAARGEIIEQIAGMVGTDSAQTVESLLQTVNRPDAGLIGTLVGVGALLIGATTVFAELQTALDRIWRAPAQTSSSVWSLIRVRLLALGMILGIGFLLIVSLIVSAALSALGKWWAPWFGNVEVLAQALNFAVGFALITTLFAMIYKWIPRVHIAWSDVWVGAAITSLLFSIGKLLIGLYIGKSGVASPFGAAASLVVLLLWVYYSAQIFLLGAEFTWVYAHRHGSLRHRGDVAAAPPPGLVRNGAPPVPHKAAAEPEAPANTPTASRSA